MCNSFIFLKIIISKGENLDAKKQNTISSISTNRKKENYVQIKW